jgi:hypothetical protein
MDGKTVGETDLDGRFVGFGEGTPVIGGIDGLFEGKNVGVLVGITVGQTDGQNVGRRVDGLVDVIRVGFEVFAANEGD